MKETQHDNVNAFLGAILDDGPVVMVFWKHCAKGSLHDLVMNEDIHLDQMFVVSILNDVISVSRLGSSPNTTKYLSFYM